MKRIRLNLTRENNLLCVDVEAGERQSSPLPFFDENFSKLYAIIKILDNDSLDVLNDEQRSLMIEEAILMDKEIVHISTLEHKEIVDRIGKKIFDSLFFEKTREKLFQELHNDSLHIQICYEYSELNSSYVSLCPWHLACLHERIRNKAIFSYLIKHNQSSKILKTNRKTTLVLIASDASDNSENGDINPQNFREAIHSSIDQSANKFIDFSEVYEIGKQKPSLDQLKRHINEKYTDDESENSLVINFYGHGIFKKICTTPTCSHPKCDVIAHQCSECKNNLGDPQGYLFFQKQQGNSVDYVSSDEFARIISSCKPKPILAVIMACYSARAYESKTVYAGIAQSLIFNGVSAVVAFPFQISDESASKFIKDFYQSLFRPNSSIFEAFKVGCDACSNEWYRPVLFVREEVKEDGKLFDFSINEPHPQIVKTKRSAYHISDAHFKNLKNVSNLMTSTKDRKTIIEAHANSLAFLKELNTTMLLFRDISSAKKNKDKYVRQILSCRDPFARIPPMKPTPDWARDLIYNNNLSNTRLNAYRRAYERVKTFLRQEEKRVEENDNPFDSAFKQIVSEITEKNNEIEMFWESLEEQLVRSLLAVEISLVNMVDSVGE